MDDDINTTLHSGLQLSFPGWDYNLNSLIRRISKGEGVKYIARYSVPTFILKCSRCIV